MVRSVTTAASAIVALLLSIAPLGLAQSTAMQVTDSWVRPMAAGGDATSAVYATIKNPGNAEDVLLSASSPVARAVELHTVSKSAEGMLQMRPMKAGLAVPAHGQVELKPGGHHIMLIGLKQAIAAGDQVPITLKFAMAGEVGVLAKAEQRVPGSNHGMGGMGGMGGKEGMSGKDDGMHGSKH